MNMTATSTELELHEHDGPQCAHFNEGAICKEVACRHDHHVSSHMEVNCTPVQGQPNRFSCAHRKRSI
jgi:hypothetical protein